MEFEENEGWPYKITEIGHCTKGDYVAIRYPTEVKYGKIAIASITSKAKSSVDWISKHCFQPGK